MGYHNPGVGAYQGVQSPRVSITLSPSNPIAGNETIYCAITIQNAVPGGSVVITQSGDLVDADFDDTLINTIAAAVAMETGITFDTGTRRITFTASFDAVLTFLRVIESDPPVGETYTLTLSSALGGLQIAIATASFITTAEPIDPPEPTGTALIGVNTAGAEFGNGVGVFGFDYGYPDLANIDYYVSRGARYIRLPFKALRLQPSLGGALETENINAIKAFVARAATFTGLIVELELHDFGERTVGGLNVKINDAQFPANYLADIYLKIWAELTVPQREHVRWGLMNEPKFNWTPEEWRDYACAQVALMRAGGITEMIIVPGVDFTGAHSWISSGNAAAWARTALTAPQLAALDSGDGWAFDWHQYFDVDSSGSDGSAIVDSHTRFFAAAQWAIDNDYLYSIGEFGVSTDSQNLIEARLSMEFLVSQPRCISIAWWGAGERWGTYHFRLNPLLGFSNIVDVPQMFLFADFTMPINPQHAPTDLSLDGLIYTTLSPPGALVGRLQAVDQDAGDFFRYLLTNNNGGRLNVVGNQIQVGTTPSTIGTYPIAADVMDRASNTLAGGPKTFNVAALAPPDVNLTHVGLGTVSEGAAITPRYVITNPVPGQGFDAVTSNVSLAQFVGTWENCIRGPFEAAGCTVTRVNSTRNRIRFGPSTTTQNVDCPWTSLADAVTEGAPFQLDLSIDTRFGVTLKGSQTATDDFDTFFINDTSLSPGWKISVGPGSAYPGESFTFALELSNAPIGAKVRLTPSGQADDADFTVGLEAAIAAALPAWLDYDAGTNDFEIIGTPPVPMVFNWSMTIDTDADANETYILTLSTPVASVIPAGQGVANFLVRAPAGDVEEVDINFNSGDTTSLSVDTLPDSNPSLYENLDGTYKEIASGELPIGDRGLRLGTECVQLLPNPRFAGGAIGTANLFTGSVNGQSWLLTAQGTKGDLEYIEITRNFTTLIETSIGFHVFAAPAPGLPTTTGFHTQGMSMQVVSMPAGIGVQLFPAVQLFSVYRNASNQTFGGATYDTGFQPGPNPVDMTYETSGPAGTANVQAGFRILAPAVAGSYTLRIWAPFMVPGRRHPWPISQPVGTIGPYTRPADRITTSIVPPPEGTLLFDFTALERRAKRSINQVSANDGQCLFSMFSDSDNYTEGRYGPDGEIQVVSAVGGVTVANPKGNYLVPRKKSRLELVYAQNDFRLYCDAIPVGTPVVNQAVPTYTTMNIGCDRNGENRASILVHRIRTRADLITAVDAKANTLKPGLLGSPQVSLAGAEFDSAEANKNWFFPTVAQDNKNAGAAYWANALGATAYRQPLKWHRLQPTLFGALDPTYSGFFATAVNGFYAATGMQCIPDLHQYGAYYFQNPFLAKAVGSPEVPTTAFVDVWRRIIQLLGPDNPAIWALDLMNEWGSGGNTPANCSAQQQPVIDMLRNEEGYTGRIMIEGLGFGGALQIRVSDPLNNLIYSVHPYLDKNGSGTFPNTYTGELMFIEKSAGGVERYEAWTKALGRTLHFGEVGVPFADGRYLPVEFAQIKAAHEAGIYYCRWAGGRWDNSYPLSIEPTAGAGSLHSVDKQNFFNIKQFKYQGVPPSSPVLTSLGKVRNDAPYPSNVWAMQVFDDKIWCGTGNSSAFAPNVNAGSGDLFYIDLDDDTFVNSTFTAAEILDEQIDSFRVIDGELVFPGIDPRSGGIPSFKRLESGVWQNRQIGTTFSGTGSGINHVFDVYKFDDKWFAAIGTHTSFWDCLRRSTDPVGITGWGVIQGAGYQAGDRAYRFIEHSGVLYAATEAPNGSIALSQWNGSSFVNSGLSRATVFPSTTDGFNKLIIRRELNIGTHLIYLGALTWNDSHFYFGHTGVTVVGGLYVATANFATTTKITTGFNTDEKVWDLKARSTTAYALTSRLISNSPQVFETRVLSAVAPFTSWTEVLKFDYPTFMRSFEEADGAWYFGAGTDVGSSGGYPYSFGSYTDALKAESGTILKWG